MKNSGLICHFLAISSAARSRPPARAGLSPGTLSFPFPARRLSASTGFSPCRHGCFPPLSVPAFPNKEWRAGGGSSPSPARNHFYWPASTNLTTDTKLNQSPYENTSSLQKQQPVHTGRGPEKPAAPGGHQISGSPLRAPQDPRAIAPSRLGPARRGLSASCFVHAGERAGFRRIAM